MLLAALFITQPNQLAPYYLTSAIAQYRNSVSITTTTTLFLEGRFISISAMSLANCKAFPIESRLIEMFIQVSTVLVWPFAKLLKILLLFGSVTQRRNTY